MRDRSEFDDLAPLIKLIRAHPPFDRETELKVTRRARKGDKRAQEQLVVHNLSLVISVARKFMGRGVRLEDLVQEGNYGLLKAIEHFDPEKGNRFSTYAVWWIRAYITRCLKDGPSAVRRTMPNGGLPPRDITINRYVVQKGLERQMVLYWYQAHNRAEANEYWAKYYQVADAIRYNRSDGSLIRITTPLAHGEGMESARQRLLQFVGEVTPQLSRYIPQ